MDFSTTVTNLLNGLSHLDLPEAPFSNRSSTIPSHQPKILTLLTSSTSPAAKYIFLTLHFLFPHDLLPALDLLDRGLVNCFTWTSDSETVSGPSTATSTDNNTTSSARHQPVKEVYYVQSASAITEHPHFHSHAQTSVGAAQTDLPTTTSASTAQGRYRNALRPKPTDTFYEIHLDSWNCSCAAFAFNALTLLSLGPESESEPPTATLSGNLPGLTHQQQGEGWPVEGSTAAAGTTAQQREGKSENVLRFGGPLTRPRTPVPICKHILAAYLARSLPGWAWSAVEARSGLPWRRDGGSRETITGWGGGWGDC